MRAGFLFYTLFQTFDHLMKAFEKVIFLLPTILFAVLLIAAAARAQGGSVVVLDQTVRAAITSNLPS
jgi:hypothetical protein